MDIQDLAEEDEQGAAPLLFGEGFEKKMKDRAESLKLLHKPKPSQQAAKKQFFEEAVPLIPREGAAASVKRRRQGCLEERQQAV